MNNKLVKITVLSFILLITTFSCGDEITSGGGGPVNFQLALGISGEDKSLNNPFAYSTFTEARNKNERVGKSGLLVVNIGLDDYARPMLSAFDLCCPYENMSNIKVKVNNKELKAVCNACKSEFDILSGIGNRISGPASRGLFFYRVKSEGDNFYRVYN